MCFSAEADLLAATLIAPAGVLALREARGRPHTLPLAVLPAGFALHQFTEMFVWLGTTGDVSPAIAEAATYAYLVFAQVLLPVLVPLALLLLEPHRLRRAVIGVALALGIYTAIDLAAILLTAEVTAYPRDNALLYRSDTQIGHLSTATYIAATCVPLLVSSRRWVRRYGVIGVAGLGLSAYFYFDHVTSIWCLWAALTSVTILVDLRGDREPERTRSTADALPPVRPST